MAMHLALTSMLSIIGNVLGTMTADVAVTVDNRPLSEQEQYLAPYLDELVDYRHNPIAKEYIMLADLVDATPTWLEDLFIPLFIPGSTLTIPINKVVDVKIPLGDMSAEINATVINATLTGLDEFKNLRPLKLSDQGRFTWDGSISMSKLGLSVAASFSLGGPEANINIDIDLVNPSLDFSIIVAFNRTRLCDVWGKVMTSSLNCAIWPLSAQEDAGVSGVNITSLRLGLENFTMNVNFTGLGSPSVEKQLDEAVEDLVKKMRPEILANVSSSISQKVMDTANTLFLRELPKMHQASPCSLSASAPTVNVSRVCFSNSAGFVMKWAYHNCPMRLASPQTSGFPIDESKCMDVKSIWPHAQAGQILRVSTEAVAGVHKISDPALRYVPNSNSAGFECSGTTLDYNCKFISIAPVDPSKNPRVQKICVINHAGFVMYYGVENQRIGQMVASTSNFPIDQTKCVDLAATKNVTEGDVFATSVHAIIGATSSANHMVQYSSNGLMAAFECTGTTLDYNCKLFVGSTDDIFV